MSTGAVQSVNRVIPSRPIIRKDRSPMNPKVWVYQLACGHDVFRAHGRLRKNIDCEKCREKANGR